MKKFKNAGLILRYESRLLEPYKKLKSVLDRFDISLHIEKRSAELLGVDGVDFKELCKRCDFLISLGGDGTLLHVARSSYECSLPILGINAGNLGFLTLIRQDEVEWFLKEVCEGRYEIEDRLMLEICFMKDNKCVKKDMAFNDAVFNRDADSAMVKVDAFVKGKLFNSYYGDGVIISTPTGSTAYNLSAGGAIIYPLSKAFILTSICPHSLTQRPLVLPSTFEVEFKSSDCELSVDGQNCYKMKEFDRVVIKKAQYSAKLFAHEKRDYFDILREKLNWGNL